MQDKRGKTKRSKAAVMFSNDEDSFTTYAKSKRELDKGKTTTRKRKDEKRRRRPRSRSRRRCSREEEEENDDDDDKNDEEEEQKITKHFEKSFKTFLKRVNVKLPKVELPKFDGSVTEWMSFRDFFGNAVHRAHHCQKLTSLPT